MVLANASALIPLAKTGKLDLLKKLFKKIKITKGVKNELTTFKKVGTDEISKALTIWIHEIKPTKNFREAQRLANLEQISEVDADLVITAKSLNETLLTNDYRLHIVAKTKGIETEWLTTILLKCVQKKILTKKQAKEALLELVQTGMRLQIEVYATIEKMIDEL